ncbi:hypothetical protein [Natronorubrum sp. FCH18a]|uniref:hypothetical protein n=1 Tax=Natronorubrum sp. FCH18a TaxID=3447018 RepID=UPI003F51A8F6
MKCEWRQSNCTKDATRRLNIKFRDSGRQHVYYFCEAHALMRISECEADESVKVLSADEYDHAPPRED